MAFCVGNHDGSLNTQPRNEVGSRGVKPTQQRLAVSLLHDRYPNKKSAGFKPPCHSAEIQSATFTDVRRYLKKKGLPDSFVKSASSTGCISSVSVQAAEACKAYHPICTIHLHDTTGPKEEKSEVIPNGMGESCELMQLRNPAEQPVAGPAECGSRFPGLTVARTFRGIPRCAPVVKLPVLAWDDSQKDHAAEVYRSYNG